MSLTATEAGRAALAWPGWKWAERMAALQPATLEVLTVGWVKPGGGLDGWTQLNVVSPKTGYTWSIWAGEVVPDLRDAATVGAVVERIRDYCGLPTAFLLPPHIPGSEGTAGLWSLLPHAGVSPILALEPLGSGPTQAHALVDAFRRGLPRPGGGAV